LSVPLTENAPAKVNLTLRVVGRRADGYHDIESLVVFADQGDRLALAPGGALSLSVRGRSAAQSGAIDDNLVLKATHALASRVPDLRSGAFDLEKELPVAAGLGGGSADAAAALRLLARANGLAPDDRRLHDAAVATGADVPVCLDSQARLMRGIGEELSAPLALPPLHAVLVNPGIAVATRDVFACWRPVTAPSPLCGIAALRKPLSYEALLGLLTTQPNDLEVAAVALAPVIAEVIVALRIQPGCGLVRMSGSGATCFGLFASTEAAMVAVKSLAGGFPRWWVQAAKLR
jgi:4-diphosphocytidyl-2-C-methyl-D-erythritol kinase